MYIKDTFKNKMKTKKPPDRVELTAFFSYDDKRDQATHEVETNFPPFVAWMSSNSKSYSQLIHRVIHRHRQGKCIPTSLKSAPLSDLFRGRRIKQVICAIGRGWLATITAPDNTDSETKQQNQLEAHIVLYMTTIDWRK